MCSSKSDFCFRGPNPCSEMYVGPSSCETPPLGSILLPLTGKFLRSKTVMLPLRTSRCLLKNHQVVVSLSLQSLSQSNCLSMLPSAHTPEAAIDRSWLGFQVPGTECLSYLSTCLLKSFAFSEPGLLPTQTKNHRKWVLSKDM